MVKAKVVGHRHRKTMPSAGCHNHFYACFVNAPHRRQIGGRNFKFMIDESAIEINGQQTDRQHHNSILTLALGTVLRAIVRLHTWDGFSFSPFRGGAFCSGWWPSSTSSGGGPTTSGSGSSSSTGSARLFTSVWKLFPMLACCGRGS